MQSYFLSEQVVDAYLRDLGERLERLEHRPRLWCPLGPSGLMIAKRLLDVVKPHPAAIHPIVWERGNAPATFSDPDASAAVQGSSVLVLDTAVHSGATIQAALQLLHLAGASSILTFAVVVRVSASIVPNLFSLLINDTDRAWLPAHTLPNQPVMTSGTLRRLSSHDVDRPMIRSGKDFIDRGSWSDHLYDMTVDPSRQVYVVERDNVLQGYVSFVLHGTTLRVDEVAVDEGARGQNFGSYLIRWTENLARHKGCTESTLWSIEERASYYQHLGYERSTQAIALGSDGVFVKMRKRILYNLLASSV